MEIVFVNVTFTKCSLVIWKMRKTMKIKKKKKNLV